MNNPHILTFDQHGWEVVCTGSCPMQLTKCEVVQLVREFESPPDGLIGRFFGRAEAYKDGFRLVIGEECPHPSSYSRRTSHTWKREDGITFGGMP